MFHWYYKVTYNLGEREYYRVFLYPYPTLELFLCHQVETETETLLIYTTNMVCTSCYNIIII